MGRMKDERIDFVICSPPYDDLREYNGYEFEFEKIAYELFRVMKKGSVMVWVVGDQTINGSETGTSFKQALYFKEIGFKLWDTQIYYKNNPPPTAGNRYHQHFEYMFVLSKDEPLTFNPITEPTKYRGRAHFKNRDKDGSVSAEVRDRTTVKKVGNVFSYSVGSGLTTLDKIAFQHPAIFPESLVHDQILTWTNEGDLVYDPFLGSGTTAKVARDLNRRWEGSEISEEYCKIAEQRLLQTKNEYLTNTEFF